MGALYRSSHKSAIMKQMIASRSMVMVHGLMSLSQVFCQYE